MADITIDNKFSGHTVQYNTDYDAAWTGIPYNGSRFVKNDKADLSIKIRAQDSHGKYVNFTIGFNTKGSDTGVSFSARRDTNSYWQLWAFTDNKNLSVTVKA